MRVPRVLLIGGALSLASCGPWRWSGDPSRIEIPAETDLRLSSGPARGGARIVIPEAPAERRDAAEFYSDLGPDAIDVAAYPAQQRYNYAVYARACSRCHPLARSVNAPMVGRGWWEFYLLGMRLRGRLKSEPLSASEAKSVLDFLDYDSRARKAERARDFEELTEELKRRFDASLTERLRALQETNRRPLPSPHP